MIIFLNLHQKSTFSRMSTPQCHEINVMTFDAKCHDICFVGRKTNVMTLTSWDLENVMRFIFSVMGSWPALAQPMVSVSTGGLPQSTCWYHTDLSYPHSWSQTTPSASSTSPGQGGATEQPAVLPHMVCLPVATHGQLHYHTHLPACTGL